MRLRHKLAIRHQTKLHLPVVREDRYTDADVARLRHPKHLLRQTRAGHVERYLRTGHIGHHRRALVRHHVEHLALHRARQKTDGAEDPHRQRRLIRIFQFVHAALDLIQAHERVLDADRQHQRDQAKVVAQLMLGAVRAQIDRHKAAHLDAFGVVTLPGEIAAQRTGHTRQQDVIDRYAEHLAHRLDFGERQRRAPGYALDRAGLAFQTRLRIIWHHCQLRDLGGDGGGDLGVAGEFFRVGHHVHVARSDVARHRQRFGRRVADWCKQRLHEVALARRRLLRLALLARAAQAFGLDAFFGCSRVLIEQRIHHADQRDAVSDAMVNPDDERVAGDAVTFIALNHSHVPERLVEIERLRRQRCDVFFQRQFGRRFAVLARREIDGMKVIADVEVLVLDPIRAGRILHHALAKPVVARQPRFERALDACGIGGAIEHHHADDHHQIGRCIHPQPRRIDTRHAVAVLVRIDLAERVAGQFVERQFVQRQKLRELVKRQIASQFHQLLKGIHRLVSGRIIQRGCKDMPHESAAPSSGNFTAW